MNVTTETITYPFHLWVHLTGKLVFHFLQSLHYIKNVSPLGATLVESKIKAVLPRRQPEFDNLIGVVASHTWKCFDLPNLLFDIDVKEVTLAEFVVFKVFRAGDSLEITPCLLKVHLSKFKVTFLMAFSFGESNVCVDYEERKYVMNRTMIQQTIERLRNTDYGF